MDGAAELMGRKVEDTITGFAGIVVGYVRYISGCNQALVAPGVDDKGNARKGEWFDEQRLRIVGDTRIVLDNASGPGGDQLPPVR